MPTGRIDRTPDRLPLRWAGPAYIVLLILSVMAFWPGYLAKPMAESHGWTHFHAAMGTLWLLTLIAQPMAIHAGCRRWHRVIGKASYVLMPAVVVSFVGLAHASMQGVTPEDLGVVAYYFYIRVVLLAIFVGSYVMGIVHRRTPAVHARYMVCTGLALIDPVGHRLAHRFELWRFGTENFDYQLLTFGSVCLILAALIWMERRASSGRQVFPFVLGAFVLGWLPLLLHFYRWGAPWVYWKDLAAGFAALPIP
ncbi:MAG: hypothetical protein ABI689_05325 [Thermoanaerobaculia bacterium]